MESRKFTYYNHHTYGDRISKFSKMIDGNEYTMEFDSWPGIIREIHGFQVAGVFLIQMGWFMINNEGESIQIPGVEETTKIWFNDKRDKGSYDKLLNDIKTEAFIDWIEII